MFRFPRKLWPTACFLLAIASVQVAHAQRVSREWIDGQLGDLVELYRHFHQHPELSLAEKETSARLAGELESLGIKVTTGVGGYGVVGVLENGPGDCVMIRADMDALPVTEETGLVYASQVTVEDESGAEVGVMHACGHDVHITCLVGVARYLAAHKGDWSGTIVFLGQPAEERVSGAAAMLKDGLFEKFPKPDYALALHCESNLLAGHVGCRGGYVLANTDSVDVIMRGRGGHGSAPHTTIDPILQAAYLVVDLQSIVTREINPTSPAVITVGSIHGGTKHNIIGDDCHLQITVRSYSDEVRARLLSAIRRKATAVAASFGAPEPTIEVTDGTYAMYNDDKLVERLMPVWKQELGDERVELDEPVMGGEDFSLYGRAGVPICMFRLGTIDAERSARFKQLGQTLPSLHSAKYYPEAEPAIATGVRAMAAAVLNLLPKSQ